MSLVRFQISTRWSGRKRTIQVHIHDTPEDLREAGNAYNDSINALGDIEHAVGLCQSHWTERYDKATDTWIKGDAAGVIRLTRKYLRTGVISHEAAHMAINIYDQDYREEHGDPYNDIENQEILAYLVGDITSRIVNKLYEKQLL